VRIWFEFMWIRVGEMDMAVNFGFHWREFSRLAEMILPSQGLFCVKFIDCSGSVNVGACIGLYLVTGGGEIFGEWGAHGRDEKCVQNFNRKTHRK
jgi:hypothetical protein